MRRALDHLLAAPGLTRGRFLALAVVSLLAAGAVIAAALRANEAPLDLILAARAAPAPIVEVARRPTVAAATPAPKPAAAAADAAPAGAAAPDTGVGDTTTAPVATATPAAPATPAKPTTPAAPAAPKKPVSDVKHVFVLDLAGAGYDATWGEGSPAAYLNGTLRPQGTLLENYKPLAGGDLATLVALVSGRRANADIEKGCPLYNGACVFPVTTLTLPDQLTIKGERWRAYVEDLGNGPDAAKSCRHPAPGAADDTTQGRVGDEYSTRLNPFVYFHSLTDLGDCMNNDLPLDALSEDLKTEQATPNFSFVAANLCHGGWEATCADGSPGGLAAADAFLAQWAPQILESPAYKAGGLLIVLFGAQPGALPADAHTGALLVSSFAKAGVSSTTTYDAFGVLRSIEDLFGLDWLEGAGATGVASFARSELEAGLPQKGVGP